MVQPNAPVVPVPKGRAADVWTPSFADRLEGMMARFVEAVPAIASAFVANSTTPFCVVVASAAVIVRVLPEPTVDMPCTVSPYTFSMLAAGTAKPVLPLN